MKGIVWLASYPKSGNTWFRVFLANLLADRPEPVDINALPTANFTARINYDDSLGWETSDLTATEIEQTRLDVQAEAAQLDDTVLKVHEAFRHPGSGELLFAPAATRAALYFLRNPLDVAVSYSHHSGREVDATIRRMNDPAATVAQRPGRMDTALPQPMGTWSGHVRSWTDEPGLPVLLLSYEDMLARPQETFAAACRFAGFPADPARVARALAHSRFERLREQEQAQGFREALERRTFFRQGQAGGWREVWREVLSPAQVSAIVRDHGEVMRRFGYLNADGTPA